MTESSSSRTNDPGSIPQGATGPDSAVRQAYWRANLRLLGSLLIVWFVVSFGFGILLVEPLNQIPLFGFKLGFWWAQQGSIFVFVVLIFIYAVRMKQIERRFGVDDDQPSPSE